MIRPGEDKKLTVCLYITGERSERGINLIEAMLATPGVGVQWDLIIGVDAISYDLAQLTQQKHAEGKKAVIIESKEAIGKSRFMFSMVANIRSTYVLLLDDSVQIAKSWLENLNNFIATHAPECIAGMEIPGNKSSEDSCNLHASAVLLKTKYLRVIETQHAIGIRKDQFEPFDTMVSGSLGLTASPTELFIPEILSYHNELTPRDTPIDPSSRLISACLCTYGDHPHLILRCLDTILREPIFSKDMEILIGCNNVSERVMKEIEQRYSRDRITILIRSPVNFNKSGIQRFTFRLARAPYILALDDDMYFKPGWIQIMKQFIVKLHPFEAAGRLHYISSRNGWSGKKKPYFDFVRKKKWWNNKLPNGENVHFPAGQCFLARRTFVVENDYPDLDMKIDWDDVLLGDLVAQLDGVQHTFWDPLTERVIIDDIPSRGQHGGG